MKHVAWILVLVAFLASGSSAQELATSDLYGRGVHAYFSGQLHTAYEYLTAAIDAGTRDPRAYFFRGLVHERLGRPQEAQTDFATGARLEHEDVSGIFGVDRALMRVQGRSRLAIERHRALARSKALGEVILERNRRTLSAEAALPEVAAPGKQLLEEQPRDFNAIPAPGAAPPVRENVEQPFGEPAPPKPNPQQPMPPANPLQEEPNPFGTPAPPANPAEKPMPQANPLQEEPNPFGNPAPPANPAQPANPANPAEPETGSGAGSARALGNVLKRALDGLLPDLPEMPAGLPLGAPEAAPGEGTQPQPQPQAQQPETPAPAKSDNPFDEPATPPASQPSSAPADASNDNPFDT